MPKTKTISARRAIAGDLAVTLGATFAALLLTLLATELPLTLAVPAAVVGVGTALWRLHGILGD
jgi:hypothetical protein